MYLFEYPHSVKSGVARLGSSLQNNSAIDSKHSSTPTWLPPSAPLNYPARAFIGNPDASKNFPQEEWSRSTFDEKIEGLVKKYTPSPHP